MTKDAYRIEIMLPTGWRMVEELDAVGKALVRYAALPGRRRILRVWHDKAHRRHFETVKDSADDVPELSDPTPAGNVLYDVHAANRIYEPDGDVLRAKPRR